MQVSCWTITGERQASRLQGLYFETLLRQEIGYFDTEMTVGQALGMASSDAITIQDAMSAEIGKSIQYLSTFLGGFLIAFARGWLLSLSLISMIPPLLIVGGVTVIILAKMSTNTQAAYSEARGVVEETIGAIKTVSSLTAENEAITKYAKKLEKVNVFSARQGLVSGLGLGTVSFILFGGYGLTIWYGSKLILKKGYTGGQVISIIVALVYGGMALLQSSSCLNALSSGKAAASNMFKTIKRKPKINAIDSTGIVLENIKGEIHLKDVYFRYPARQAVEVFSGLSLHISSGKHVALVGKSGCGKSTVISLLERFYDPDAGEVLIDGVSVKRLQLRWLREKIGLVSQEPVLFATTIRENIAYGKENATEDEINKALQSSSAAAFIKDLPLGLDTMVGNLGAQLSGGQKQRIAIARIILKDPTVFLLDEITSALDTKTEKAIYDEIFKIASRRTAIIVTHSLSSVENVDSIAVMHQGKIVEQGTHAELIRNQDGHYSKLVSSQGKNQVENSKRMNGETRKYITETMENFEGLLSSTESITRESLSSTNHSSRKYTGINTQVSCRENEIKKEHKFQKHSTFSIKWLANQCKDVVPILLIGTFSAIVHGIAFPVYGFLFATAITIFYEPPSQQEKDSSYWAQMYVFIGSITFLAVLSQNYSFGAASGKLIKQISLLSFDKIVHREICWFDDPSNSSGSVGARLSCNASMLQSLLKDGLSLLIQNISTVFAGLFIALMENWMLALILVALCTMLAMLSFIQTKFLKRFAADAELIYSEQSQVASDAIGNIRTVASICAEDKVMELYRKKSGTKMTHWIRLGIIRSINFGISQFGYFFTSALCFYIGSVLVEHKKSTVAELFKVYLAFIASAAGIAQANGTALDANKVSALASSLYNIFDSKETNGSSSTTGMTLKNLRGDLEFQNVSFSYPSRPNVQILKDVSLNISPGKAVVFVGESGNGKSTLISLVERFYDVKSGCILLDAIDIRNYNLKWLRQQIALVSQEPILFKDTIRRNITYGRQEDTTEDEIVAAAKLANAHNFISALPQGYNTHVGECGAQLSGGQKQRIAIARAIVKDPKILLLDEATSSLDAESEKAVQAALNQVMVSKTAIVVTHRLTAIRGSDTIAFLRNGVIVEKGRHDELIKTANGAYASLFSHHLNRSI
ncbi:ABC transporter B family member 9 [Coffea arabica]|uniref:ABC transporter B family member 9 n=1 Tax=Coffea arabica TaxID=13443 RepID=A0A6P6UD70_COFAR